MSVLAAPVRATDDGSGRQVVEVACRKCGHKSKIQANLGRARALEDGCLPFPKDDVFRCPGCGAETNLGDLKRQVEAQARKPVVT